MDPVLTCRELEGCNIFLIDGFYSRSHDSKESFLLQTPMAARIKTPTSSLLLLTSPHELFISYSHGQPRHLGEIEISDDIGYKCGMVIFGKG